MSENENTTTAIVDDTQLLNEGPHYYIYEGGHVHAYDPEQYVPYVIPKKYQDAFDMIVDIMDYKGSHYVVEPLDYIDPITILHQVRLKVERSLQVKNGDKQLDDIKDLVVYGIRLLQRVLSMRKQVQEMQAKVNSNRVEKK